MYYPDILCSGDFLCISLLRLGYWPLLRYDDYNFVETTSIFVRTLVFRSAMATPSFFLFLITRAHYKMLIIDT